MWRWRTLKGMITWTTSEIIFTHSYSINRLLIFFHIIPARSHLTASSPKKDEYPTPSFYTPFFQFFLPFPQNCYNLWRSYFNGNTTLIGTCSALSLFDFNSASFFTLRLSVYSLYRDRVEGGTTITQHWSSLSIPAIGSEKGNRRLQSSILARFKEGFTFFLASTI